MKVLVDGHNAIGALRIKGRDHEGARRTLLRRVASAVSGATVYFDARQAPQMGIEPWTEEGVKVVYCREREADDHILERVREASSPESLLVVTNDREVAGRARQLGAQVQRVQEFFAEGPPPQQAPPSRGGGTPGRRLPNMGKRFTPADFGLPDEVDLDDPDID